jgi:hypothetical protein
MRSTFVATLVALVVVAVHGQKQKLQQQRVRSRGLQSEIKILSITIINTNTSKVVGTVPNGGTVSLSELGLSSPADLNFGATVSGNVTRIAFTFSGASNFTRTDIGSPFSSCGEKTLMGVTTYSKCMNLTLGVNNVRAVWNGNSANVYALSFTLIQGGAVAIPVAKPIAQPTARVTRPPSVSVLPVPTPASTTPILAPAVVFPKIESITLINTLTGGVVGEVNNGTIVSLSTLGLSKPSELSFGVTTSGNVTKVTFIVTGTEQTFSRIDMNFPFAACGDRTSYDVTTFSPCTNLTLGKNTVRTFRNGNSTFSYQVTFTLQVGAAPNSAPAAAPVRSGAPVVAPVVTPVVAPVAIVAPVAAPVAAPVGIIGLNETCFIPKVNTAALPLS